MKTQNTPTNLKKNVEHTDGLDTEVLKRFGLSRKDMLSHDFHKPMIKDATIDYLEDQRRAGIEPCKALEDIRGMNASQIIAFRKFGLSKKDMLIHDFSDIETRETTFAYLEDQGSIGIKPREALGHIRGKNAENIRTFWLGDTEALWHHNFQDPKIRKEIYDYLKVQRNKGLAPSKAMPFIKWMKAEQIQDFRESGGVPQEYISLVNKIPLEDMVLIEFQTPDVTKAAFDFFRDQFNKGLSPSKALYFIIGLDAEQIQAFRESGGVPQEYISIINK